MINKLKRLSIRSVDAESIQKMRDLQNLVRLPMALLIEDAIDLLWESYVDAGYDMESVAQLNQVNATASNGTPNHPNEHWPSGAHEQSSWPDVDGLHEQSIQVPQESR